MFDFESLIECLFTNVCAKNIYIHPWCEEAVYRAPIHNVTDRQTDATLYQ